MFAPAPQKKPATDNPFADDVANFAKALVQPLKAEQMLDALGRVLEAPVKFDGYPSGTLACQLPDMQMAGGCRREKCGR